MAATPRYHVLVGINYTPTGASDEVRVEPTRRGKPVVLAGLPAAARDAFLDMEAIEMVKPKGGK